MITLLDVDDSDCHPETVVSWESQRFSFHSLHNFVNNHRFEDLIGIGHNRY